MTITIRQAIAGDAAAIARVRIDAWRTTYRGIVPDAYLDAMDVEASTRMWDRVLTAAATKASVFVAENEGEVVGFAAANLLQEPKHDFNAELSAIYLRRDFRRAGIGRRLVRAVTQAQREKGANGLIVWVIAENRVARSFYEALGGTLLVEQDFEWDGIPLVEAGYGFRDIDALLVACDAPAGPERCTVH
jgi:GNAT superfamily N-acetyltransferase